MGKLDYEVLSTGEYLLRQTQGQESDKLSMLQHRLGLLLAETKAYRNYWTKMTI
jgi:hypothetical protein